MISQPTGARLLQGIRQTLDEVIRPALAERTQLDALDMIDSILHNVAVRSEFEYAWMVEEINDIVAAATALVDAGQDSDGRITQALRRVPNGLDQPVPFEHVRESYTGASSLLSLCLRAAGPISPDSPLDRSLRLRLAHEDEIRGPDFQMAGRG